jgi:hypothetical protein
MDLNTVLRFGDGGEAAQKAYLKEAVSVIRLKQERDTLFELTRSYYIKNEPLSLVGDQFVGEWDTMPEIDPTGYSMWKRIRQTFNDKGKELGMLVYSSKLILGNGESVFHKESRRERMDEESLESVLKLKSYIDNLTGELAAVWDKYSGRELYRIRERLPSVEKQLTLATSRKATAFNALLRSSSAAVQLKNKLDAEAEAQSRKPVQIPPSTSPTLEIRTYRADKTVDVQNVHVETFSRLFVDEGNVFTAGPGYVIMSNSLKVPLEGVRNSIPREAFKKDKETRKQFGVQSGSSNLFLPLEVATNESLTALIVEIGMLPAQVETVGYRMQKFYSDSTDQKSKKTRAHEAFITLYAAFHDVGPIVFSVWDNDRRPIYLVEVGQDLTMLCKQNPSFDLSSPMELALRKASSLGLVFSDIKPSNLIFLKRAQTEGQVRFIDLEGAAIINDPDFATEKCILFVNTSMLLIVVSLESFYSKSMCFRNSLNQTLRQFVRSQLAVLEAEGSKGGKGGKGGKGKNGKSVNYDLCGVLTSIVYSVTYLNSSLLQQSMDKKTRQVAEELIRMAAWYSGYTNEEPHVFLNASPYDPIFPQLVQLALSRNGTAKAKRSVEGV